MQTDHFAKRAASYFEQMRSPTLPPPFQVLLPWQSAPYLGDFLRKFYDDDNERILVLGINPGRLGGGATGVSFTDPVALRDKCGIDNDLEKRTELSSQFVYCTIERWGAVDSFYRHFFLAGVCPFGLVKDGVNANYYDDPKLEKALRATIEKNLFDLFNLGCSRKVALVIGSGKNKKAFEALNKVHRFVERIIDLEHPRFIKQYKSKSLETFYGKYVEAFNDAIALSAER